MENNIDNLDIKLNALEEAVSYPSLKKQDFGDACIIEIDTFNYETISAKIRDNEKLTNMEGAKVDLILEILRLLNDHKIKYNVELHDTVGFYFRGLPILVLKVIGNESNNQERMIYISVKTYKDELSRGLTDKKLSRLLAGTIGGLLLLGGVFVGYKFVHNTNQ